MLTDLIIQAYLHSISTDTSLLSHVFTGRVVVVGKSCLPNKLLALKSSFVLTSSVLSADNVFKCLCEDVTARDLVGETLSFGGQKHSSLSQRDTISLVS